ncbi:transglutaminase domain-containing protein, partial [bacterium]
MDGKLMKFKRMFIYRLMPLTAVAIILPFATLVNKDIAYYAYKEATYGLIIKGVIKKDESPDKQLILINEFLYRNFSSPYRADVIDKDIFNDLMRGIAWCDQRAWALVIFAGKLGIEARLVFTKNPEGVSTHTVSEAKIGGRWMLFDPQFGFFGRKNSRYPASYDDICRHPELFLLNEKMLMLKKISPERYAITRNLFSSNIYYKDYLAPVFWTGPVNSRNLLR